MVSIVDFLNFNSLSILNTSYSIIEEELESKKFKEAVRKFHKIFKLNESEKLVNCKTAKNPTKINI